MTGSARVISKIALVLADVDGTLLTSEKVPTSQAAMTVKELRSAGFAEREI
jgi:hydroxymethylpyrimidine pyrophosphatase-like HAD family hydrolase